MTARTLGDDEIVWIKRECLDNLAALGALPYLPHRVIYDVVQTNIYSSDVDPTSSTTTVSTPGACVLTLASVTGIVAGTLVSVDVDSASEVVRVRAVSGATVSVIARKAHAGTYPVEIQSPLTIVRGMMFRLQFLQEQQDTARDSAGLKRVDEVEWFGGSDGGSPLLALAAEQYRLRMELARTLGLGQVLDDNRNAQSGGADIVLM